MEVSARAASSGDVPWRRSCRSPLAEGWTRVRTVVTDCHVELPPPRICQRVDVSFIAGQCAHGSTLNDCCCSLPFFPPNPSSSSDALAHFQTNSSVTSLCIMDPTKAQTTAVFAHLKNQKANKVRAL